MLNPLHGEIPRLKVESVERAYVEHKKYCPHHSDVLNFASRDLTLVLCPNLRRHVWSGALASISSPNCTWLKKCTD